LKSKLSFVNYRKASDARRVFLQSFRVAGSAGNNPLSADNKPGSAGDMSQSPSNHSIGVWENNIFFLNAAGMPRNLIYEVSFDDF
jgi:hypothetical protein